ncbi:thioredoxin family protein [Celeribacter arenosi]|uniref:Thioredoxin family protein n=1 Tax=Celeribacter arenosi TaxID=792649 RepID=A0ABP7KAK6_9RHOB
MDRRLFLSALTASLALPAKAEVVLGDDGLHDQPFFLDSFLELGPDLEEAGADGKGLIVLFEQRGCPYCRELHRVNFERSEITDYLTTHFNVLQLDMWGSREVIDLDGEAREERRLAAKWFVNFTPTQVFLSPTTGGEVFRMPGYFKPFHHLSALEYVATGANDEQPFQRFLQDKFAEYEAKGIDPDVW